MQRLQPLAQPPQCWSLLVVLLAPQRPLLVFGDQQALRARIGVHDRRRDAGRRRDALQRQLTAAIDARTPPSRTVEPQHETAARAVAAKNLIAAAPARRVSSRGASPRSSPGTHASAHAGGALRRSATGICAAIRENRTRQSPYRSGTAPR